MTKFLCWLGVHRWQDRVWIIYEVDVAKQYVCTRCGAKR